MSRPDHDSLVELFESQARQHPAKMAARCGNHVISFTELKQRTNQLARYLRKHIRTDMPVGICISPSIEMLIGVLGIVKAGGAYLPLDPDYPRQRLLYMLEDSKAKVVVCYAQHESLKAILNPGRLVEVIDLAAHDALISAESDSGLCVNHDDDSLAYVIYTSGSTGVPKGVLGTHGGMLNRLRWMWNQLPFQDHDVGCVKTSLNFLDSFWEIFGNLSQAIPVVVIPTETVRDTEQLVQTLESTGVSRIVLVPTLLRSLLDTVPGVGQRLRKLACWVSSGEALRPELASRFHQIFPEARLLNLYGSSEVSADCTWHEVTRTPEASMMIGRPIANNEIYLLDADMNLTQPGSVGEIYVGGVGLARGYLGWPELTAERFLPNPFASAGGRMFRTGDLAVQHPDGETEYVGRADQQVKIRGFRVELSEIEKTLCGHPQVSQAAVVAREDGFGRMRLIGYVVSVVDTKADAATLRQYLAARLPDYMVPAALVLLDALPLTPSGKLDRNSLPSVDFQTSSSQPRNDQERILARLFAEVLDLKQVGIDDKFFDLGGDSVTSLELVCSARDQGLLFSPHDVFRLQSVQALAALLTATQERGRSRPS